MARDPKPRAPRRRDYYSKGAFDAAMYKYRYEDLPAWERRQAERRVERQSPEDGARWAQGDMTYTVNNASDPNVQGDGYYLSQSDGEDHATTVYNEDGSWTDTKANRQWDTD